jgi:hypothetical protein
VYHTVEGLLMMGVGLAMLAAECWLLNRLVATMGPAASREGLR